MSDITSESLAVRYRPQTIEEFVGNQPIKQQIQGWVKQKRFPNALLIEGEFGAGKTSCARLLARLINCQTHDFCGKCLSCRTPLSSHPDYEEANMSDTRGIDDVRALLQKARFAPKFNQRILMLDEIHGLASGPAAQALLKGLEEPSPRTMWILSTNMANKVLPTIVSRCVTLRLQPPEPKEIVKYLWGIARKEGMALSKEEHLPLFKQIAELSGGHVRNAVQMLESVLASYHSGHPLEIDSVLKDFVNSAEQSLDNLAVEALIATCTGKGKPLVSALYEARSSVRGLIYKMRFMIDNIIGQWAGTAKFSTANVKLFQQKVKLPDGGIVLLNHIQQQLVQVEQTLNTVPGCDDRVVLLSTLLTIAGKAGK